MRLKILIQGHKASKKSTTAKALAGHGFNVRGRYLREDAFPPEFIERYRKGKSIPSHEMAGIAEKDVEEYDGEESPNVLQDTFAYIRNLARLLLEPERDEELIERFYNICRKLPKPEHVFFFDLDYDERVRLMNKRIGGEHDKAKQTDRETFNKEYTEKFNAITRNLTQEFFPKTIVLDVTGLETEEIVEKILDMIK